MKRLVRWVVQNGPAINTLMAAAILVGVFAMLKLRKELLPEFQLDLVTVSVIYPGASPTEVEEGICQKIEEAIRSIEGIKSVSSVAREGVGTVTAELSTSVDDPQRVVNEIRSEVDQVPSFPLLAEDPDIKLITVRTPALRVAVYGGGTPPPGLDGDALRDWSLREERQLRDLAEGVRDELLALDSISLVEMIAVKDYQIDIEIPEQTLRRHGLSLQQVADLVRRQNIELPAGEIKAASSEYLVRGKNKRDVGEQIAELPLLTRPDGAVLRVGDLGRVQDGFTDDALRSFMSFPTPEVEEAISHLGGAEVPAVILMVQKTANEDLLEIVAEVYEYLESAELPQGYGLVAYDDQSILVTQRLATLTSNGLTGLLLVFVVLSLFLELRLAFWVAMGIPVSVAGACVVMYGTGQTLNMVSTFAFLLALGIVVDDAIVIGESIFRHREMGKTPVKAAIEGTLEVAPSVLASVTTTIIAFAPMFFVSGTLGKIIYIMPLVVVSMLVASLIESIIILPNHLAHGAGEGHAPRRSRMRWLSPLRLVYSGARWSLGPVGSAYSKMRHGVDGGLQWVIERLYTPALNRCLKAPFVFLSGTVAVLIASMGLVASGLVPFVVFPKFDANYLRAEITFPSGTPASITDEATRRMADAMADLHRELAESGSKPVRTIVRTIGYAEGSGAGPALMATGSGAHIGYVFVEMVDGEERGIGSEELASAWRERVLPLLAGYEEIKIASGDSGPGGKPVEFQLVGPDLIELEDLAELCKEHLANYEGLFDISDSSQPGKPELQLRVRPEAEAMGIDTNELALTVRSTFYGEEVMRLQRGRHEVKLMVRYPESERDSLAQLQEIRIRTPQAGEVPLEEVAQIDVQRGYSTINRIDQKRSVTVSADLIDTETNAQEIVRDLQESFLPPILARHPGVSVRWEGQEKETQESVSSLLFGFVVALFGMFVLLTAQFRSYLQPIFVMIIIPFGMIGAIWGHLLMGLPLTLFSMFGLVALAGVLVNDSIVLIDFINARVRAGIPIRTALRESGRARFRPVLLTSLTTIAALLPLLLETSLQVQVLIPMATSLAFGLSVATAWVLFLVPTIYSVYAEYLLGLEPEDDSTKPPAEQLIPPPRQQTAATSPAPIHAAPDGPQRG
ncbi:efflux RND transporter permease subunit [soil metagenome]